MSGYKPQTILEELILKYPDREYNWSIISTNPNIRMDFIEKYIDKPLNWKWISYNPHLTITFDFIEKYPDKPWNWYRISRFPDLNIDFVIEHHDKPWDWHFISNHPNYKERKDKTIKQTLKIKEELLSIAMHPSRVLDWCVSNEERNEIKSRWG